MIELLNMDCMDYMATLKDKAFDLLIQDTPFGVTQNKWDIKPNLEIMWPEWLRVCKENAAIIFFGTQPFVCELILSMPNLFRYDLIWYKRLGSGFLNANKMPMRNHEHILMFYRKLPTYNPQKGTGNRKKFNRKHDRNGTNYGRFATEGTVQAYDDNGVRHPQSVIDISNGDRTNESDHPTQKPVDLFRYLIKTYSNPYENIFDGYSGSGTTAIACHLENRNAVCCEIDKDYYDAAVKRYENAIKQQTLFDYNQ